MTITFKPKLLLPILLAALSGGAAYAWVHTRPAGYGEQFISGNGRIEATEIDVAAKLPGRLQDILVNEGDFVREGQVLAHMQVKSLDAQRAEALAQQQHAQAGVASAAAAVAMRESDRQAAQAVVAQRAAELEAARRRLARSDTLVRDGAASAQELDDDQARVSAVAAGVRAAQAQEAAGAAAIEAARMQLQGARAAVTALDATLARIQVDIDDGALTAVRDGRVQYRIAQPGEVLPGGGKVLNLVDLSDVYMTFFVPETAAGKLAMDSEVHLVLDALPQYVIPARVSYVASTAQFTPKTVETANERQKLMFRVKARIDRALLQKYLPLVKTGVPGVAWVKLDNQASWPAALAVKVPQ
jgi:HlyD family secretion protein